MSKSKKTRKKIFKSVSDFEKTYFPSSYRKKQLEEVSDGRAIGASLARESLKKVRRKLAR